MSGKKKRWLIIGSGGHAGVLLDTLLEAGESVLGFTDSDPAKNGERIFDFPVIGNDSIIQTMDPGEFQLALGIGCTGPAYIRKKLYNHFSSSGWDFPIIRHPSAIVSPRARVNQGAQILARSFIGPGTFIGTNTIINSSGSIDHNCIIEDHVHIAPGVTLSGNVRIGECSHIGTGASIIQRVSIGKGCLIGAGSTVIRDIEEKTLAVGVPAKKIRVIHA